MSVRSSLTAERRARDLDELCSGSTIDVLVVGGGVTGTGVALDAASRGYTVALVERADLAFGTSRWSSKLVHGGLRYLAQGDLTIAYESARERAILMGRTAPHLVRPLAMVVPVINGVSRKDAALVGVGHNVAYLLKLGTRTPHGLLPRPRRLDIRETLQRLPGLERHGLRGGHMQWDGQLEDDARLVVALARTAAAHGARVLTYVRADAVDAEGADVTDVRSGSTGRIRARAVINAAGVWAGSLDSAVRLRPSKGAHIVVPSSALGNPTASMTVAVPDEPHRYVFALPQPDGLTYIGLTDDPLDGAPPDEPSATSTEVDFLLSTISRALARPLSSADVVGSFAGLRPLLEGVEGRTADLSRRHAVRVGATGAWSVLGGKLTTYRAMAQDAVDAVVPTLALGGRSPRPECRTASLPLVGAYQVGRPPVLGPGVPARLLRRYGTEAAAVAALAERDPSLLEPVAPGVPVLGVELAFGVAVEGAMCVDDLLARRTRLGLVPEWAEAARPAAERALDAYVP